MMNKKISKLLISNKQVIKKKIIEKLRLKYPRIERSCKEFQPILPEEEKHYFVPEERNISRLSSTLADEGYQKFINRGLHDLIEVKLDQVIYRALKAVYGRPDVLSGWIVNEFLSKKEIWPVEWGYLLRGEDGSCFEIFQKMKDREIQVTLWFLNSEKTKELPKKVRKGVYEFIRTFAQLARIFDNEYLIKTEMKRGKASIGGKSVRLINNLYYQNIQSGKDMIEHADKLGPIIKQIQQDQWVKGKRVEAFDQWRKVALFYVSSILFSFMALEGFVNLLYKFLLLPEFSDDKFNRVVRGDLDLRILHLTIYCKGFSNASITPDDTLYKKFIQRRDLRNNLVHANITDENEGHLIMEDKFFFEYNPLFHLKLQKKKKPHAQQLAFGKANAVWFMQSVEQIIDSIIDKMDKKEKTWVTTWNYAGRIAWIPGNEDYEFLASLNRHWKDGKKITE